MIRRPVRRAGFSLVEVLVAIFITAAGLIALLTLFPLGAIQMGRALQNDRSQQAALQMDGKVREYWRSQWVEGVTADTVISTLDDADGAGTTFNAILTTDRKASYPVMLDPLGFASYNAKKQQMAVASGGVFPRRTLSTLTTNTLAFRFATLQDDMEFGPDGTPADRDGLSVTAPAQSIFRAGRYNCAAVIQRQDNSNRFVADLKLLVFDRRVPGVDPTGVNENELMYTVSVAYTNKTVTLPASNDVLGLRRGAWIMDGTLSNDANGDGIAGDTIRNANFYRVVSVDADSNPAQTTVELHIPIVKPTGEANPLLPYNAHLYIMRELIDVYDRPQLTPTGYLKQSP